MDTVSGTLRLRRVSGVRMCAINEIARTAMRVASNRLYEMQFIANTGNVGNEDGERLTAPEPMKILRTQFGLSRRNALDLIQSADLMADSRMDTWVELPLQTRNTHRAGGDLLWESL
ncbi:MAG: hypothetical protein GX037_03855 [Trueperella sp.]|nr:hypothetical protein [Trueperella sp.]